MKHKKRVPLYFAYKDCDAFADYLEQQSLKGWHFQEFRFGMVFEAGEPQKKSYDVEVFPKSKEADYKPDENVEEYSGYCEAAGWRFVDSIRKFCVFEKISEDAVAIVTPQERSENIAKAEWQLWSRRFAISVFQFLIIFANIVAGNHLFDQMFVDLFLLTALFCVTGLLHGIILAVQLQKMKRRITEGKSPVFTNRPKGLQYIVNFKIILILCVILLCVKHPMIKEYPILLWYICFYILIMTVVQGILAYVRPEKGRSDAIVGIVNFSLSTLMISGVLMSVMTKPGHIHSHTSVLENMPFTLSDYGKPKGEVTFTNYENSKSMLGNRIVCSMIYETADQDPESVQTDSLFYAIYQSPYRWVMERVWKEKTGQIPAENNWKTAEDSWNAKEALISSGGNCYLIRYEELILDFTSNRPLTDRQIQKITSKIKEL